MKDRKVKYFQSKIGDFSPYSLACFSACICPWLRYTFSIMNFLKRSPYWKGGMQLIVRELCTMDLTTFSKRFFFPKFVKMSIMPMK